MIKQTTIDADSPSGTRLDSIKIKAGRPKNLQKRQQILSAASCLFLQQGFSASSMDNVAHKARVSKQTVYSHFANKEALFTAVIQHKVDQYQLDGESAECQQLPLDVRLTNVGHRFIHLLQDPDASAMYRIVIGEFNTAPQAAELFYKIGPQHGLDMFCDVLTHSDNSALASEEKRRLAVEFFNLLKGEYHMRNLIGLVTDLTPKQEKQLVNQAVQHVMSRLRQLNPA